MNTTSKSNEQTQNNLLTVNEIRHMLPGASNKQLNRMIASLYNHEQKALKAWLQGDEQVNVIANIRGIKNDTVLEYVYRAKAKFETAVLANQTLLFNRPTILKVEDIEHLFTWVPKKQLAEMIASLTPSEQWAFKKRIIDKSSISELAEERGIGKSTIVDYISQAKRKFISPLRNGQSTSLVKDNTLTPDDIRHMFTGVSDEQLNEMITLLSATEKGIFKESVAQKRSRKEIAFERGIKPHTISCIANVAKRKFKSTIKEGQSFNPDITIKKELPDLTSLELTEKEKEKLFVRTPSKKREEAMELLNSSPEKVRHTYILRTVFGATNKEIGEHINISPDQVKEALKTFQRQLKKQSSPRKFLFSAEELEAANTMFTGIDSKKVEKILSGLNVFQAELFKERWILNLKPAEIVERRIEAQRKPINGQTISVGTMRLGRKIWGQLNESETFIPYNLVKGTEKPKEPITALDVRNSNIEIKKPPFIIRKINGTEQTLYVKTLPSTARILHKRLQARPNSQ